MAHELGHNLGMLHDFIDPYTNPKTVRTDSTGGSCTNVNGVMDYYVTVLKWSKCSNEKLAEYYQKIVASQGKYCLPTNPFLGLYFIHHFKLKIWPFYHCSLEVYFQIIKFIARCIKN
jgi:hypothetical protein